ADQDDAAGRRTPPSEHGERPPTGQHRQRSGSQRRRRRRGTRRPERQLSLGRVEGLIGIDGGARLPDEGTMRAFHPLLAGLVVAVFGLTGCPPPEPDHPRTVERVKSGPTIDIAGKNLPPEEELG